LEFRGGGNWSSAASKWRGAEGKEQDLLKKYVLLFIAMAGTSERE
jgi:hypothetical protein